MKVLAGEVIDERDERFGCWNFLKEQIARAKDEDVLYSFHLKATMMKVQDPIIFGHGMKAFFPRLFDDYGDSLTAAGISANDGLDNLLKSAQNLPADERVAIERAVREGSTMDRGWPWSTTRRHHQPARAQRRDHRCLDAGDDPHLGTHVGSGW